MCYTAMPKDTTIGVNKGTWRRLNSLKEPGDSFEDVINRLIRIYQFHQEEAEIVELEG